MQVSSQCIKTLFSTSDPHLNPSNQWVYQSACIWPKRPKLLFINYTIYINCFLGQVSGSFFTLEKHLWDFPKRWSTLFHLINTNTDLSSPPALSLLINHLNPKQPLKMLHRGIKYVACVFLVGPLGRGKLVCGLQFVFLFVFWSLC